LFLSQTTLTPAAVRQPETELSVQVVKSSPETAVQEAEGQNAIDAILELCDEVRHSNYMGLVCYLRDIRLADSSLVYVANNARCVWFDKKTKRVQWQKGPYGWFSELDENLVVWADSITAFHGGERVIVHREVGGPGGMPTGRARGYVRDPSFPAF